MVPSKVFNFVLIGLLISSFVAPALALPYAWETDPIQLTWSTLTIPSGELIINDLNQDGIGDVIYNHSTGVAITKVFGSQGVSSFTITAGTGAEEIIAAKQDRMLAHYGNNALDRCQYRYVQQWSLLTGSSLGVDGHLPEDSTVVSVGGIINKNNKTAALCYMGSVGSTYTIFETPLVNQSSPVHVSVVPNFGPQSFQVGVHLYSYDNLRYTNGLAGTTPYYGLTAGNQPDNPLAAFTIPANVIFDPKIKKYITSLAYPTTSLTTNTLLAQSLVDIGPSDPMTYIISLPPTILHSAFTSAPVYFKINDGTTTYLAAIVGNTLYYTNYNTLVTALTTNRAIQQYTLDFANVMPTGAITLAMPTNTVSVDWLNGTAIAYSSPFQIIIPSGYHLNATSSLQRFYYPEYENLPATPIPIRTFADTHNTLSLKIKNAPGDAALKFVGFTLYNNTNNYVYTTTFLQADNTVTMSIPEFLCGNIFIKDISVATADWVDIGILCADGVSSREMAYTPNFPITFYSFDWGATHNYTPSVQNLQTAVRSATTPYNYNVIIKHANGTVAINQTYTTISTLPDTRNYNVSTVAKPASLFVYSDGPQGAQIYSAYLGSPVSLASMASFFNQYFSYQGFNLVSFIPIIFAAMFTRNTVGLGTVLTVVCIATFSWLSVIVVPDLYIYIMVVIAVLGLIGYRMAYPQ